MRCAICNRRVADCTCKIDKIKGGKWPRGTWFQKRLKKVKIAELNGKQEHGRSAIEVLCGLTLAAILAWTLVANLSYFRQVYQQIQNIERCVGQLYNCSNA
jgi:hypothetical protein